MGRNPAPHSPEGEKLCSKCGEFWPAELEFFYSDDRSPDGLYYCCKACYAECLAPPRRRQVPDRGPQLTLAVAPALRLALFPNGAAT